MADFLLKKKGANRRQFSQDASTNEWERREKLIPMLYSTKWAEILPTQMVQINFYVKKSIPDLFLGGGAVQPANPELLLRRRDLCEFETIFVFSRNFLLLIFCFLYFFLF